MAAIWKLYGRPELDETFDLAAVRVLRRYAERFEELDDYELLSLLENVAMEQDAIRRE